MKKLLITLAMSLMMLLTACGEAEEENNDMLLIDKLFKEAFDIRDKEEVFTAPMQFTVVYGNGTELSTEIECIAMPKRAYLGGSCSGLHYKLFYNERINDADYMHLMQINLTEVLPAMYVKLCPDGQVYSLSEAYHAQFDTETLTLTVYVWRDEPYENERNIFKGETE